MKANKPLILVLLIPIFALCAVIISVMVPRQNTLQTEAPLKVHIAVASNFTDAIKELARQFEENTNYQVTLSFGSTGKHYAQIINGAPYDLYFAADSERPKLLDEAGVAVAGSRFTYAIGKIILWSPMPDYVDPEGAILETGDFNHLAIANPDLAPYGKAAREVLIARGLWDTLKGDSVRGENIGQTYQFVHSGNAELGFVAYSQIMQPNHPLVGSYWEVPQSMYTPIEQQVVLLTDTEPARDFLNFIQSEIALDIIRSYGYGTQ